MYRITKTINDWETISLVFYDAAKAKEVFHDLMHDELVRFNKLYTCGISRENIERKMDYNTLYKEYKISVPAFSVTITLTYVKD